jgi:hypothetical protein
MRGGVVRHLVSVRSSLAQQLREAGDQLVDDMGCGLRVTFIE